MSNPNTAEPAGKSLRILVIHAPDYPPDEVAFTKLLENAELSASHISLKVPVDIVDGLVNLKDFDRVLVILTEDIAIDNHLEECMLVTVRYEVGVTGIWDKDTVSNEMHPAVRKYGIQQIPWDSAKLFQAIVSNIPQGFQSSNGKQIKQTERHKIVPNRC